MIFSSVTFLFYFLPITMALYFCMPLPFRNGMLLLCSLFFYAWGEPRHIIVMGMSIAAGYGFGLLVEKYKERPMGRVWCVLSVCISLSFLLYFKYADFFLTNLNRITGANIPLLHVSLPIGISFYTFQMISYTVDVYRGETAQKNIVHLAVYITMFPQLIAGPIVRYADIARQIESNRRTTFEMAAEGIRFFVIGLAKKILLADQLAQLCVLFRNAEQKSVLFYWIYALGCSLYIYFDFSGYSDMAVGLGRIFGFYFPENFRYPFVSASITEFWRRWHRSLGTWFRDYVYIPLGGNRCGHGRQIVHIFIVWMLTGLWHGAEWNFVIWGLYFAVLICAEKLLLKKEGIVSHMYFLFFILISFVIFHAQDMEQAVSDLGGLFGAGGLPVVTEETLYYLRSYAGILLFAVCAALPCMRFLSAVIKKRPVYTKIWNGMEPIALLGLMVVISAYLVDSSFHPFLYFRF
uniref:MBOAT family protein n=1 Tax=Eubacterium plexicaudatum ASF492 TaxID=1235802 RepID=N2ADT0_9FIRM